MRPLGQRKFSRKCVGHGEGCVVTLAGLECTHEAMTECCPGCGHLSCPCGIEYDSFAYDDPWSFEVEHETVGPTADDFADEDFCL